MRQAQIDAGQRDGVTSVDGDKIRALQRENREPREANEILKAATREPHPHRR